MSEQISAVAAYQKGETLKPFSYDKKELGEWDVLVEVTHCGICHSDVHLVDDDFGMSTYPLVPGHEIVGSVNEVGSAVKHLKAGDRVGIGWQAGSCMNCEWCEKGEENLCAQSKPVCVGNFGGFGTGVYADSRFAFKVPEALESENAAPLLCGGATVFSPLHRHGIGAGKKVGVIGIGGLGHLAIQFAKALGAEVTAFSTSPDKIEEAKGFGATHFVATKEAGVLEQEAGTLDFIISTVYADLDWNAYMNILRPMGKLCMVGVTKSDISIQPFQLIVPQREVVGSVIGSRKVIELMLETAAAHGVQAKTELYPFSEVNEAMTKVKAGKARYRAVLKI